MTGAYGAPTEEPLASRCVVNGNVGARHAMGGADLPRVAVAAGLFSSGMFCQRLYVGTRGPVGLELPSSDVGWNG
jgi:hypothetical protein